MAVGTGEGCSHALHDPPRQRRYHHGNIARGGRNIRVFELNLRQLRENNRHAILLRIVGHRAVQDGEQ